MEDFLEIKSTEVSPAVLLSRSTGSLSFSGKSLPENPFEFYLPIINWINSYVTSPQSLTTVEFHLEYFNTASSKQIFKILSLLKELSVHHNLIVKWHYEKGDKDMMLSGERFAKLCGIPIDLILL